MNLEKLEIQVRALIDRDQKIEAIKLVRETTGWGLRESKDYVDTLGPTSVMASRGSTTGNWVSIASRATDLLDQGMKEQAIEWVMGQAKLDAQEAQDYVDFIRAARLTLGFSDNLKIPAPVVAQIHDLLTRVHKVEAVKLVRVLTNWGLRDSKECVDSLEPVEAAADYAAFSADELLTALEQAGRTPDLELVRACLNQREALAPDLLTMLAQGPDPAWDGDDPRQYRDIHAGLLLCAFREPSALPIFFQVFRDEERDVMLEWFGGDMPIAYGPAVIPFSTELMNDASAYDYARNSAMGMLTVVAWNHPGEREVIVQALRALLPPLVDGKVSPDAEESELWTWIAHSLMKLRDMDSQPQVQALYRAGMIDEWIIGDEQEYLASLQRTIEEPSPPYDVLETYRWLHRQAEQEARQKAEAKKYAAQEARRRAEAEKRAAEKRAREQERAKKHARHQTKQATIAPQPVTRIGPKVGRNAPCPCGSGRKYKHCCGKKR